MKTVRFFPGAWEDAGLTYAYSWRFPQLPRFRQEEDSIANSPSETGPAGYDYLGLLGPETRADGAEISIRCSFEGSGAPMIVFSMENETDGEGVLRTLEYYEVVIWKNGLNVWRHRTRERRVTWKQILGASFPLKAGVVHTLTCAVRGEHLEAEIDGRRFRLYAPDLAGENGAGRLRAGYTACEGICRLYEMTL